MNTCNLSSATLSLLVLKTSQIDKLRAFYESLGIRFIEEQHGRGPVHYAGQVGPAVLEIYPLPKDVTAADTTTRLGFAVENLRETVDRLKASATSIVIEPQHTEWGFRSVVKDSDGRSVELSEREPRR